MNKLDIYISFFALIFFGFYLAYFLICASISVAPSDWALMALAVVTAVEIVVTSLIKIKGQGMTEETKDNVSFVAEIVGKLLGIEAPSMRSTEAGIDDETDEEGTG